MKLILLLLSLCILTTPMTTVLAENEEPSDPEQQEVIDLPTYETSLNDDNTLTITKYNGNETNITIPETIDNIKVSKLASNSFNNDSIESVLITFALELEDTDNIFSHETIIKTILENTNIKSYADKYLYEFTYIYRLTFEGKSYYIDDYQYVINFTPENKSNKTFIGYYDNNSGAYYNQGDTIHIKNNVDLIALYKNNTYRIIFDSNGATNVKYTASVTNNTNVFVPANTFTRKGYAFVKWNTKADGTGTSYYGNSTVNNLVTTNNGSITLYAIWGKQSTITLYNNKKKVKSLTVYKGIKVGTLPTVSKKGYTFTSWYTAKTGGTKVTANTLYNYDKDIKLYAQFKVNTYNITYNLNGGTNNSNNPTKFTYGKSVSLKKPTRVGYTFSGWYRNNKKVTKVNGKWTENITLVAKWTPIKYTIKYKANGGKGTMKNTTSVKYDSLVNVRKNTFTKKGATFIGWTLNKEGTGRIINNQEAVKNLRNTKGNITLYAKWKYTEYTITYNLNGGIQNSSNPTKYTINSAFRFSRPTREGYFFQGWFTESNFVNSKAQVKNGSTGNITLYAKWAKLDESLGAEPLRYYMVQTAKAEMGNVGGKKFWSWYGFNGRIAWCAIFVSWVANQNGVLDIAYPKAAGVSTFYKYFTNRNAYKKRGTYTPQPGDIIFFDWNTDGRLDHVGLVEKVEDGKVFTLEGNSKGDTARAKSYPLTSKYVKGYGVPNYKI